MGQRNPLLLPESEGPLLCYDVPRQVTVDNYTDFLTDVQTTIKNHGEFRLLLLYGRFENWAEQAAEQDVTFYVEYGKYMKKFCLVGPPDKEIMSKMIASAMIAGELKIFSKERYADAVLWAKS